MGCCTCAKTVEVISRFILYFTFLVTILALSVPGWSTKCQPCVTDDNKDHCYYLGLFSTCEAVDGREECWGFNPRTVDKSLNSRGSYAAAQAFMVMSAILATFYVLVDMVNWFVKCTQDVRKMYVMKYVHDAWFFYSVTIFQGLFALIAQAIWAQQKNTHTFFSESCGKIYMDGKRDFGDSFGLATLTWVLCVINIIIRLVFRRQFKESSDGSSRMEELSDVATIPTRH